MDGFDVHAFGWILTRSTLGEALRIQIGFPPRVDSTRYDRVSELWGELHTAMILDRAGASEKKDPAATRRSRDLFPDPRVLLDPRRAVLGERSKNAMRALLEFLVELWPERFSHAALTKKFWNWTLSAAVNLILLFFVLPVYDLPQPLHGYALIWTLLFGMMSFAFAFQYNRAATLFGRLGIHRDEHGD